MKLDLYYCSLHVSIVLYRSDFTHARNNLLEKRNVRFLKNYEVYLCP